MTTGPRRLLLLDTASLYFRAYYGVPESVRAPDGTPVNAVRGLLDFVTRLVGDHRPTHLVACMDADWRPRFRVEAIPSYKAHRVAAQPSPDTDAALAAAGVHLGETGSEEVPDTLAPQVPVIEQVLDALGIARVGVPGFEADDVIGGYAARSDVPVDVVTGDRDLFQLVDDARGVRVLYTARGVGAHEVVDEAEVLRRYGVPACAYADFAVLRGDPSDGLPGVRGIGEKTAAQLITAYGDLAGVRRAAEDLSSALTPARRRAITAASSYLDVAPSVVRVADDLPLPADVDTRMPSRARESAELDRLGRRWGLGRSLVRVMEALADRT